MFYRFRPVRKLGLSISFMIGVMAAGPVAAQVALEGDHEHPNQAFGEGADYRLVSDATFGWRTQSIAGQIDLNGHTLVMDTGGGNTTRISGRLRGEGKLVWSGGGEGASQRRASYLEGESANDFVGSLVLERGVLVLNKSAGVNALAGPVQIGSVGWAELRWGASNQLADEVSVQFVAPGPGVLNLDNAEEASGTLALNGDAQIRLGEAGRVHFSSSREVAWGQAKQLLIYSGGERAGVWFGDSASALSPEQVASIGFVNPFGQEAGLYRAELDRRGRLGPNGRVEPIDPPFDLSAQGYEARRAVYEVAGLAALSHRLGDAQGLLKVSLFGDSITWQDNYARFIRESLAQADLSTRLELINRGINGGGVGHLIDGAGGLFDQDQPGFAEVLGIDRPDIAVVFIGVNDVDWLKTDRDVFRAGLESLVEIARDKGVTLILATHTVHGERPDGTNPLDERLDAFAAVTREVAEQSKTPLIDLRSVFLAYLKNNNTQLRLDGSVSHEGFGLLTYDRIHPTAEGNRLIAEHVAAAIAREAAGRDR